MTGNRQAFETSEFKTRVDRPQAAMVDVGIDLLLGCFLYAVVNVAAILIVDAVASRGVRRISAA